MVVVHIYHAKFHEHCSIRLGKISLDFCGETLHFNDFSNRNVYLIDSVLSSTY